MGRKPKKNQKKNKRKQSQKQVKYFSVMFLTMVPIMVLILGFEIMVGVKFLKPAVKAEQSLPVLKINLSNTTLAEINSGDKKTEYGVDTLVLDVGGEELIYENVSLRGRGNFSWTADKKSYRVKFDGKVDLLGMGKKKKWALIANSVDGTLMRNDLAYYLAELVGDDFPLRGEFVELMVDEEDIGVYYLIKTMEIDKQAVYLKEPKGILVEVDNVYCEGGEDWYKAENGDCLVIKDAVKEDEKEVAMGEFLESYNNFARVVSRGDLAGVEELVDVESFAKYFVLSEFTANPDAYITSWYLYKDGEFDKIHAGLAWDFDAAFGNKDWGGWPEEYYEPTMDLARFRYAFEPDGTAYCGFNKNKTIRTTVNVSWVMCDFLKIPEFRERISRVYLETLAAKREEILGYIESKAKSIRKEAMLDAKLWGKTDFDESVDYLVDWVKRRFDFFEEEYVIRKFDLQRNKRKL